MSREIKKGGILGVVVFLSIILSLYVVSVSDADFDGVPDQNDLCASSDSTFVDAKGCTCSQKNCQDDNNPCTTDCYLSSGLVYCGHLPNNDPCGVGVCSNGTCTSNSNLTGANQTKGQQATKKFKTDAPKYIVELDSDPLAMKTTEIQAQVAVNEAKIASLSSFNPLKYYYMMTLLTSEDIPKEMDNQKKDISLEKEDVLARISSELKKPINGITGNAIGSENSIEVSSEYEKVFNGFALDVSDEEAKIIENIPGVKKVYPNLDVKATLMNSVPLINAPSAWDLDSDGKKCISSGKDCITGKGITIAIIDTGVDYTHKDLGKGIRDEKRDFDTISYLNLLYDGFISQTITMDGDRLVFYFGDKLYINYFSDGHLEEVPLPLSGLTFHTLKLKGDLLAFIATNPNYNSVDLYLYNIKTKVNKKIDNLIFDNSGSWYIGFTGHLDVSENYVAYMKESPVNVEIDGTNYQDYVLDVYSYDILTNNKKQISSGPGIYQDYVNIYRSGPLIHNNLIAYTEGYLSKDYREVSFSFDDVPITNNRVILRDIETLSFQSIDSKEFGTLVDFKYPEILKVNYLDAYIYDVETKDYEKLDPSREISKDSVKAESIIVFPVTMNLGKLEEDIVYFGNGANFRTINAYDRIQKRYVKINPLTLAFDAAMYGKRVCLIKSEDKSLICHQYNPDYDYPEPDIEFGGKVIGGYDFVNLDSDPIDDNGHGTHVAATAAGNPDSTLEPYDKNPPLISVVSINSISQTSATVTWITNEDSDSQVEYGQNANYSSITDLDSTLTKTHSKDLEGLSSEKLYHYWVKSKDQNGNLATSNDFTFCGVE